MVHSGTDTVRISAILFSGKLSFSQQMGQKGHRETSERRNPIIRGTIGLLLAICVVSSAARAKYGGGSGVPDDPYLIYTAEQMNAIGTEPNDWGRHFRLMADIDLDVFGTDFNIIGAGSDENAFTGVFDGGGHQIANFSHSSTGRENIGLFGFAYRAQIKSLKLVDPNVDAGRHLHGQGEGEDVGVLVGHLQHGTVSDCQVNGGSARGNAHVGGLVGHNAGTVANCTSSARVTANNNVGGLVGTNDGTVSGSYASAHVSGQSNVGGLVGNNDGAISDCYAVGAASGHGSVGGLVGMNDGGGIILNCYSTSIATGTIRIGGLLGAGNGAAVYHSYWDTSTSGLTTSGGGEGKTTAELQSANTFTTWGCNLVWTIDEGVDYPRLRWQNIPGEIIAGPSPFESVPGGGAPSDPYLIYTAEQFNMIGRFPCQWDKHFKLMADIDLSAYFLADYSVIGRIGAYAFSGVFDGNGKRIYNFSCVRAGEDNVGLFGCVGDPNAQIKNLGLIDPAVTVIAGYDVGSLVGLLEAGTITDCYVQGGTVLGQGRIGALAGSTSGTIAYCHSNASVLGPGRDIGGLVGNNAGQLSNCYCSSDVSGGDVVGGLAGANFGADDSNGLIENCHATGTVQGDDHLGGLVGGNWAGTIRSCYSAGSVKGTNNVGGLLGLNEGGLIEGSFWDVQVSGQAISDGGTGKTTAEMQTAGTFLQAGWDFVGEIENGTEDLWCICEAAGYPKLTWEFVLGDFDADGHTDFGDLGILGERWLETDSSFFCGNGGADLTGDSFVGLGDLLVLADNWLRK